MEKDIAKLAKEEAERIFGFPNSYFERGFVKGYVEGYEKGIEKVILHMTNYGLSIEQIADYANISLEKVKELIKNNTK